MVSGFGFSHYWVEKKSFCSRNDLSQSTEVLPPLHLLRPCDQGGGVKSRGLEPG